eukprot:1334249-Prymnesium_polylepis.1
MWVVASLEEIVKGEFLAHLDTEASSARVAHVSGRTEPRPPPLHIHLHTPKPRHPPHCHTRTPPHPTPPPHPPDPRLSHHTLASLLSRCAVTVPLPRRPAALWPRDLAVPRRALHAARHRQQRPAHRPPLRTLDRPQRRTLLPRHPAQRRPRRASAVTLHARRTAHRATERPSDRARAIHRASDFRRASRRARSDQDQFLRARA